MFSLTTFIVNDILKGNSYTSKKIQNTIHKLGFNENIEFMDLLSEDNEIFQIVDNQISLTKNLPIPIIASLPEKEWLKMILTHPQSKLFLEPSLIEKLSASLEVIENTLEYSSFQSKSIHISDENQSSQVFIQTFKLILEAILNRNTISYSYKTRDKVDFHNYSAVPYKIEYSILNDMFRLFMYSIDDDKPIKVNLSQMQNVSISQKEVSLSVEELEFKMKTDKSPVPLKIEVENTPHIIERCFSMFSQYNKEAYLDTNINRLILKIDYYLLDEAELIKDILSFGSHVIVLEPESFRNKIIQRIEKVIV